MTSRQPKPLMPPYIRPSTVSLHRPERMGGPLAGSAHAHPVDRSAVRAGCVRESLAQGSHRKVRAREGPETHRSSHGDASYRKRPTGVKLRWTSTVPHGITCASIILKKLIISTRYRGRGAILPAQCPVRFQRLRPFTVAETRRRAPDPHVLTIPAPNAMIAPHLRTWPLV